MHIDMEAELVFTVLIMIFVLCASYLWIVYTSALTEGIRIGPSGRQAQSHLADTTDGDSCDDSRVDYAIAAQRTLQRHIQAITNISAAQVSPQLYSNYLISAETFSMISTRNNFFINKDQMLVVYDDLRSKVALCSSGFVKFVDILRSYPEYEGLANDLQGTYYHWCSLMKLPIPKTVASSCDDANKDESNTIMPFTNMTSTEVMMLEAKLSILPDQGYCSLNEAVQKFSKYCNILQQSFVGMIVGKNCVTVKFQVPASSLPILEKKMNDSEQFLSSINISVVKLLDKTIFKQSDSQKSKLTSSASPCVMAGFLPELEDIGINGVNCVHHGILQTNRSRCTVVLHEGVIHVGGGTTGRSKDLCKVLMYDPDAHLVSTIEAKVKFFSLVVVNNKLTTIGGMDNKIPTGMIYSWDSTTREWRESSPPMPTARRSTTSITYGNYLIVIGGALSETVTIIEVLDVPNKKWYRGPSLPEQMYNVQAVVVEHSLYLLGGSSVSVWYCSLPTLITGAISTFYNLAQLWKRLSSLPYRYSAAALLGKHLLAIGGYDEEAANMTDLIHCYSPENNCWEKVGVLRTGRRNCTAIKMLDESVFVIGGADSPAYKNYCQNVEVVSLHIKQ